MFAVGLGGKPPENRQKLSQRILERLQRFRPLVGRFARFTGESIYISVIVYIMIQVLDGVFK